MFKGKALFNKSIVSSNYKEDKENINPNLLISGSSFSELDNMDLINQIIIFIIKSSNLNYIHEQAKLLQVKIKDYYQEQSNLFNEKIYEKNIKEKYDEIWKLKLENKELKSKLNNNDLPVKISKILKISNFEEDTILKSIKELQFENSFKYTNNMKQFKVIINNYNNYLNSIFDYIEDNISKDHEIYLKDSYFEFIKSIDNEKKFLTKDIRFDINNKSKFLIKLPNNNSNNNIMLYNLVKFQSKVLEENLNN